MSKPALLLIDIQNDYFPYGKFPLWNTELLLSETEKLMVRAYKAGVAIILIQHIAESELGLAPFFNQGTKGADIHARILAAAPDAPVVIKTCADSFYKTNLEQLLSELGVDTLWLAGMMTQNCVTHTALSKVAEKYEVSIVRDLCSSVDEMIHNIALRAISIRIPLISSTQLLM